MKNFLFNILMLILFKYLLSIFLVSKTFKKTSYIFEFLISSILFFIIHSKTDNLYFSLSLVVTEYLINKLIVLLIIITIKTIAFKLLISVTHNDLLGKVLCVIFNKKKLCKNLKQLSEIVYGPRLKHGLPAMANKKHKKTKVKYDKNGFPKFHSYYTFHLMPWNYRKSRQQHFNIANKALYKKTLKSKKIRKLFTRNDLFELKSGNTPNKYTWHHHQNPGKMQLVLQKTHAAVNHVGGYSIWGKKD